MTPDEITARFEALEARVADLESVNEARQEAEESRAYYEERAEETRMRRAESEALETRRRQQEVEDRISTTEYEKWQAEQKARRGW